MISEHGSAAAAIDALPEIARQAGVENYAPCPEADALAEMKAGKKANARLVRYDGADYPAMLRDLADAPPVIWVKGDISALGRPMLAVIGARNASSLGLRMARGVAGALAERGVTVVAGLARGIDTAAHEASVKFGTIAVMAGGIDQIYPAENKVLAATLCEKGCLLSEQPPGLSPVARHFPLRNRIISGLSHGVVVVEAAVKSGSLITARNALDQGREVLAVPGHPVDGRAGGCNQLIRDGAILVRNSDDILDALPALAASVARAACPAPDSAIPSPVMISVAPARPGLPLPHRGGTAAPDGGLQARVLAQLSPNPVEEDSLIRDLGVTPSILSPVLLQLELAGKLTRIAGGRIALQ
ncbi:MAG: DNA-protecting protein DprA [Paracoccus denitrificans]|uniref:DNA-protecting protein DprA n=1 Tax=Paracoccus denitrificans TaxID=266 RepID=A0A533IC81_PARDE|nr:MAG: DNA-protecting protein DprA [Paracoccus denitrificans]